VPLTVAVTNPTNNSTFTYGTTVTIGATASHQSGTVASVAFQANAVLIGTSTTAPYSVAWSNMDSGVYTVTAVARDTQGLTVTSSPITVKISKALKSVRNTRRNASIIDGSSSSSSALGSGGDSLLASSDLDRLVTDIEQAYLDFNAERAMFGGSAEIEKYLFASLFLARSSAGLAKLPSQNDAITDRMNKLDAYLSFCEDLMVSGTISQATRTSANQVNAKTNLVIDQPNTLAPTSQLLSPNGVGMIVATSSTPFTSVIINAPNGGHTYELGNVSVTIKGQAAELLSVSPTSVTFKVPNSLAGGLADTIVTSRDGFISYSTAGVSGLNPTILLNSENLGAGAVLTGSNVYSGIFSTVAPEQFGFDIRTRLSILAMGISTGLTNTDLNNDVFLASGQRLPNLAESVTVEARTASGTTVNLPVEYAGMQGAVMGLDQITVMLPAQLAGAGAVQLTVVAGNVRSNSVTIVVQ
jgi:uncharacterized protein (TIGR03437 family)